MLKRIKIKLDAVEGMLYYWQATKDKEKVGEAYLNNMASNPEMKYFYDNEFNEESVRKVLSAISNREIFHSDIKKERVYWNNNMWMLEDLDYTNLMIAPLKVLNLDSLIDKLQDSKYEELEVVFVPAHSTEYIIKDYKLIINFFRVKADLYENNKITIGDQPLVEYIEGKLRELIS
ncbi:TDE2712 family protein [Alkaliphilus serpentinus]|uniref:Uncharacterized protein n=1 Tax=Alkaliphilus serpentinus TaxID=1482731 RepID=A0A833HP24_9FIRM|nr:hypothetical protein [Alkaliphilus serpentinus]KAB3530221.1 hypothetical protein F8153_07325 [Alkaliphilus serpentinus]